MKWPLNFEILKESRANKHLSLGTLAYMVGDRVGKKISRQAIHNYERGKNTPPGKVLMALCKILEIDPKRLLDGWTNDF
jgi:predicted transcriptional regulator